MNFLNEKELFMFLDTLDHKNMKEYLCKLLLDEVKRGNKFSKKYDFLRSVAFVRKNRSFFNYGWRSSIFQHLYDRDKKVRKNTRIFLDEIKIFKKGCSD